MRTNNWKKVVVIGQKFVGYPANSMQDNGGGN